MALKKTPKPLTRAEKKALDYYLGTIYTEALEPLEIPEDRLNHVHSKFLFLRALQVKMDKPNKSLTKKHS